MFAAAGAEVLPDVVKDHRPIPVAVGFALGIGAVLAIRSLGQKAEAKDEGRSVPWGLYGSLATDLLLDGLLIGASFYVGARQGALLGGAIAAETFALGLALSSALAGRMSFAPIGWTLGTMAVILAGGVVFGDLALHLLSHEAITGLLSFGLAALLYLVTEELLVEAHEAAETPFATAFFFVGFLIFLVLGMIGG